MSGGRWGAFALSRWLRTAAAEFCALYKKGQAFRYEEETSLHFSGYNNIQPLKPTYSLSSTTCAIGNAHFAVVLDRGRRVGGPRLCIHVYIHIVLPCT